MFEPARDPNLVAAEAALSSLTPASSLNRDLLLFRAGQASVQRRWTWPALSGGLAAVAALLSVALVLQSAPNSAPEIQIVQAEPSKPAALLSEPTITSTERSYPLRGAAPTNSRLAEYRSVQDQLLRWGLDAVPSPPRLMAGPKDATLPKGSDLRWYQFMFDSGERL